MHREMMEQILHTYGLLKETSTARIRLYKNVKTMACSLDGDTDFFNIIVGILQEGTLALYPFIQVP